MPQILRSSFLLAVGLLFASGCAAVRSSAVPTEVRRAHRGEVRISALHKPARAKELGVVEANGNSLATLADVAAEFKTRVASLGGNYGRIDNVKTKFEMQTVTYTYQCGASTCTGVRQQEVSTLSMLGTAYWIEEQP